MVVDACTWYVPYNNEYGIPLQRVRYHRLFSRIVSSIIIIVYKSRKMKELSIKEHASGNIQLYFRGMCMGLSGNESNFII